MVPIIGQGFDGTLGLEDLWLQHNDHRTFFPRLVMLALALPSGWNIRWELAANIAFAGLVFLVVGHWLRQYASPHTRTFSAFLAALLVFNLNQWENWAWGLQLVVTVNAAAMAGGLRLLALDARRLTHLAGAAVLGIVATFSFANGLLFWPLSLPLVLLPEERRWQRGAAWLLLAAAAAAVFFNDYTFTAAESWRPQSLWDLVRFGGFVCVYLGAPVFAYDGKLAFIGGAVAALAFAVLLVQLVRARRSAAALPWAALAGYAVASGLLTALGRLPLGLPMALSSRYVIFGNFFWLGLLGLVLARLDGSPRRIDAPGPSQARSTRHLLRAAAMVMTLSLIAGSIWGGVLLREQHSDRTRAAQALLGGFLHQDHPLILPGNQIAPEHVEILRRHRLSLFRRTAPRH